MQIAILGAGGVGGYYGGVLARAGHEVEILARGPHLEAIREGGLEIRSPDERPFRVRPSANELVEELRSADLALVAVKSYSLESVAPAAAELAVRGADILPLLNGVEATARLRELGVPADALLGGVTYISSAKIAPGVIERRSPFHRVIVGEPDGGPSERARNVAGAFAEAGVDARASDRIDVELWRKMIFLSTLAAACGMARAPVGPVRDAPGGRSVLERGIREAAAVARARGVPLPDDEEDRALALLASLPAHMLPSFVLDLEAGGPTELDILSAAISRMAREHDLATPLHDTATAVLSAAVTD